MHVLAAVTAALVLTAQTEAPPPPPLPEDGQTEEAPAPPPLPSDRLEEDAPPAPDASAPSESAPKESAPNESAPSDSAPVESEGLAPFTTFLLQGLIGCGSACLLSALPSFIPYVGCVLGPIMCLVAPPIIGTIETVVGDWLGQQRGTLLWTILGAYGGYLIGAVASAIVGAIGGILLGLVGGATFAGLLTILQNSGGNPLLILGGLFATYGIVIVGALVVGLVTTAILLTGAAFTPALVYMFTAEDKLPGDNDFRFPGLTDPAHKKATEALFLPDLSGPRKAMAY